MSLHQLSALESEPEQRPGGRLLPGLANVAAALVALPMLAVVVTRWGSDYFPVQDLAVIDLRLRDVTSSDMPLVGVYSQFGWNHPGPALYVLLKPFLLLSGGAAWGMIVGSAIIHGAALTTTVLIAKRSAGPRWALAWAMVCALSYVPMGPWVLLEAWNPHIAYPIFILFALLSWRFLCVPGSYAIWVAIAATLLVQLHIGYLPLVGSIGVALLWAYWRARRGASVEAVALPIRALVAAMVVLWALPVTEAVTNRGGNLRALFQYFVLGGGEESRAGPAVAGRLIASEFRILPTWLGGTSDMDSLTALTTGAALPWLLVPVLLVVTGAAFYRRCEMPVQRLLVLSWIALGSGFTALALLRGKVAPYLFYWRTPVAILVVLGVVSAALSVFVPQLGRDPRRVLAIGVTVVISVAAVAQAVDVVSAPRDVMVFERIAQTLASQVEDVDGPVIVRWAGSPLSGLQAGVLDELDRRGMPIRVDRGFGYQFGGDRELDTSEAARIWYASEQGFVTSTLERLPGAEVVARVTPLSDAEELELGGLQARAVAQLRAAGRTDVIRKLDSSLAVFDLEQLGVLTKAERDRFVELSEEVTQSGIYRAGLISFKPDQAPTRQELDYLSPG